MTQAEHPVQSPDVTTSVNSSAHCGFSGGMGPPYSARTAVVRYRAAGARDPRSRALPGPGRAGARTGRSPGSGWSTPATAGAGPRRARLRAALVGRSFTAARRRGKLLLLDTDGGPTLGLRFGMTGGPGGRRAPGARPPPLRPRRLRREVGAGAHHVRRRGPAPAARPAPLRLARARARREPARARRAHGHPARAARRAGDRARARRSTRRRSRPA